MGRTEELSRQDNSAGLINQQELELQNSSQSVDLSGELSRFNVFFSTLLHSESPNSTSLFLFIERLLRQYSLSGLHSRESVLTEAYLRGVNLIKRGHVIANPDAWLKASSLNIIRELFRQERRTQNLMEKVSWQHPPWFEIEEDVDDFNIKKLESAFQSLSSDEQQLLNLKIVKGASWSEIREILKLQNGVDQSEAVLRKRKERALMRLRKAYHLAVGDVSDER